MELRNDNVPPVRRERGIALLMTLILIVAMLGMGLIALYLSSSSIGLATNVNARQSAMNAARAGIQHARLVLAAVATTGSYGSSCPTGGWSCVLAGRSGYNGHVPTASTPTDWGAVIFDGTTALQDYGSPSGVTSPLGSYTVYLRNDPAEITQGGANFTTDTNNVVVIRAVGYDKSKTAMVVLEASSIKTSTTGGTSNANTVFGKNIDPYGSNSISGSFHF